MSDTEKVEEKKLMAISQGEYVLSETENTNQFYFYRKDNEVLGDVGRLPMDMYQAYICQKMFAGEITSVIMNNILFETSDDGKCIRLTTNELENTIGLEPIHIDTHKEPSFGQKIKSLFKRRK